VNHAVKTGIDYKQYLKSSGLTAQEILHLYYKEHFVLFMLDMKRINTVWGQHEDFLV
jgi:hypothetical protein